MYRGLLKNVTYVFVFVSPAVPQIFVYLTWMVFEMECYWLDSCFVRCWFQDLFKTAHSILVYFSCSFYSMHFNIHVVHPYSSTGTATAWKNPFIILDRSDFHMIDILSIAIHTFSKCILTSLSVDEILLPRYVNLFTNFIGLTCIVKMAPSHLKLLKTVLFAFTWRPMPFTACCRLCSKNLAWVGVFTRSIRSSA